MNVYMPHSKLPEDQVDEEYLAIDEELRKDKRGGRKETTRIIMGDFNARVGNKEQTDDQRYIGEDGHGHRDIRGSKLVSWAIEREVRVDTMYDQGQAETWTHRSDGTGHGGGLNVKSQLDYCMTRGSGHRAKAKTDQTVNAGSDHRYIELDMK